MKRFLIVGSGPRTQDWIEEHRQRLDGWLICPMNHAWMLFKHWEVHHWFRSTDFYNAASLPPRGRDKKDWETKSVYFWKKEPWWYAEKVFEATMSLNVLAHLVNSEIDAGDAVALVGCDMVYPKGTATHFYGTGQPDPLRFGLVSLDKWITNVRQRYAAQQVRLVNVGYPVEGSRLLIERESIGRI